MRLIACSTVSYLASLLFTLSLSFLSDFPKLHCGWLQFCLWGYAGQGRLRFSGHICSVGRNEGQYGQRCKAEDENVCPRDQFTDQSDPKKRIWPHQEKAQQQSLALWSLPSWNWAKIRVSKAQRTSPCGFSTNGIIDIIHLKFIPKLACV